VVIKLSKTQMQLCCDIIFTDSFYLCTHRQKTSKMPFICDVNQILYHHLTTEINSPSLWQQNLMCNTISTNCVTGYNPRPVPTTSHSHNLSPSYPSWCYSVSSVIQAAAFQKLPTHPTQNSTYKCMHFFYLPVHISAVLFQFHENQYSTHSCCTSPVSCISSFTDPPHHFDSGDYK
jgi:hypothetical protein